MSRRVERIRVERTTLPALAARDIASALSTAVRSRGSASLCLAGGNTPQATYEALATETLPWGSIFVYFGDERAVPPDDADSNYRMAREALLDRISMPPSNVHRMRAEDPDRPSAARDYDLVLPDALDVLILGIGEDGHTASLFPGSPALDEIHQRVVPVVGPKPPPERLTLTPPPIAAARLVVVLAAGAGKARAVARALEGAREPAKCPAQLARDAVWYLDHDAASELSGAWPAT